MAKKRIHELAKEINGSNKDLGKEIVQFLIDQGFPVKTTSSGVDEEMEKLVKEKFSKAEKGEKKVADNSFYSSSVTSGMVSISIPQKSSTFSVSSFGQRAKKALEESKDVKVSADEKFFKNEEEKKTEKPKASSKTEKSKSKPKSKPEVKPQKEETVEKKPVVTLEIVEKKNPVKEITLEKVEPAPKPENVEKVEVVEKKKEVKVEPVVEKAEPVTTASDIQSRINQAAAKREENKKNSSDSDNNSSKPQKNPEKKDASKNQGFDKRNDKKNDRQGKDRFDRSDRNDRNDGGRDKGDRRDNRDGRDGRDGRDNRDKNDRGGDRFGDKKKGGDKFALDTPVEGEKKRSKKRNKNRDKQNEEAIEKREARGEHKQSQWVNPNLKNGKNGKQKNKNEAPKPTKPAEPVIKNIKLPEVLTVNELAEKIKVPASQLIKKLFLAGKIVTINSDLDFEQAAEIALEYNYIADEEEKVDVIEEMLREDEEDPETLVSRPPVVCVMGHVDHGKTSLLDAIRKTSVTSGEAGGITQHIGAYTVEINGEQITFLDTPGHEAFTAMRMRGAQSTDIAILVVAADDGVMPQTIEAINHAKAAGIEIIVAVNKIDKESANVERVKQELMEYELVAEDWGGSTVFCPVSAHTGEGIDNLLEMILLTSEVLELKANPNRKARGIVIEAELDKGRGPVTTVLVQKGTLHVGDTVTVGEAHGKVRAMTDDKGRRLKEAGPSDPVEILGLNAVPNAGDICIACDNEKEARSMSEAFIAYSKEKMLADTKVKMSLDDLYSQIQAGNVKELNIVVKADVQGSVEAVKSSLMKLSNEEVVVKIIHSGVGAINESDVILASASNAIIIGFNVRPDVQAKTVAETEKVDLRLYKVIYDAISDIESAMKGMLDPVYEEKIIGHAEIRQIFKASAIGMIAGSYVLDGEIQRGCTVRISREGEQIFEGPLASLKRFKDDVKEVKAGYECGLVFDGFGDLREEDQIEAYIMVEVPR
ncbi:MAG: translation initiation factor IF-2 [Lachnospiraceae bacterium]|nr:translation initiation factor IF-2 [Lachnospiraceae bacterium]